MIFDPGLRMCVMMRRSILGLLYVPAVSCLRPPIRSNSKGNDLIGHFRWCCAGSNFLECIRQATQSRDGTDTISSSRWVYFCIGEIILSSLFSAWTVIKKLRIDTCSFYFVSSLTLELIGSHLSKPFSKVMRLVNFFMTLFGPVSFKFVFAKKKIFFCNVFLIIIIIKSSLWFVAQFSKWEICYLCFCA